MITIVLLEAHPLMRLGLHQMLSRVDESWQIIALDMHEIDDFDAALQRVTVLLFGLPSSDTSAAWSLIQDVLSRLQPEHTLLLSDDCDAISFPRREIASSVFGCISKTASIEVLEAAIRLGLAGGECFPRSRYAAYFEAGDYPAQRSLPSTSFYSEVQTHAPGAQNMRTGSSYGREGAVPHARSEHEMHPSPREGARNHSGSGTIAELTEKDRYEILKGARLLNITPRQYEVLLLLARGYPLKTVSRILNISTATAKAHASTLHQRLHVNSKGEAVFKARQRGADLD